MQLELHMLFFDLGKYRTRSALGHVWTYKDTRPISTTDFGLDSNTATAFLYPASSCSI